MANNLLAYPLLKEEAGGTTANQVALNELQSHAPFSCYGHGRDPCRSDSRRAALSGHYPSFDLSRAEPIGYLAGALFLRTYMDRVP